MIQNIRGTKDLLPDSTGSWQYIEEVFRQSSGRFGYQELRTPIIEKTEVFARGIGEGTDVVNKEMYTFNDRSGDSITLRPEMTAALVRSVLQNNLHKSFPTLRLWYFGPFFRYERPQKGRQRQFHQYGAECIGPLHSEADIEVIGLANDIIRSSGIKEYKLLINTLGSADVRKKYTAELVKYLEGMSDKLSHDSQTRLSINPLRVLDSKAPEDKEAVANAPQILDFLDSESKDHFDMVISSLDGSGIDYQIEPRLVRGLDYYCHTVFEFQSSELGSQDSIGGGGRYNTLFQQLGSKDMVPAVGFAIGVERLLIILEQLNALPNAVSSPDIYLVLTDKALFGQANAIANKLRGAGNSVITDLQRRSFKAQFKEANKVKAKYSIVIGPDDIESGKVNIKKMDDGNQQECAIDNLAAFNF